MTPKLSVVVTGNPFDGLAIHGPFEDDEEAANWADRNNPGVDWWCVDLEPIEVPAQSAGGQT